MHDGAVAADQNAGRCALHAIPAHRHRDRRSLPGLVHADRKGQPVFVNEGLQRHRRHRGVVLEHGVQSDHLQIGVAEQVMDALRLRRSVGDAARAQHLKCMDEDRTSAQAGQRQRRLAVEPARHRDFGSGDICLGHDVPTSRSQRVKMRSASKARPSASLAVAARNSATDSFAAASSAAWPTYHCSSRRGSASR